MDGKQLYVLFEHACGYGLFNVREFEEVGEMIPEVAAAVSDLARFNSVVKLVAFNAFKSSKAALENINAVSEGVLHPTLRDFIISNLPMKKAVLGCGHRALAEAIQGELEIPCLHSGAVPEITRGIRVHFPKMVPGLSLALENKAQIGLGHSYSRARVKFNINRADNMIIQSINLIDQMDKDINTFAMRLREWYSYHFPELIKLVPDNQSYVRAMLAIRSRGDVSEEAEEQLEEILNDSGKARAVIDATRSSMGMDITPLDLMNIEMFAKRVLRLMERRRSMLEYLQSKMSTVAPNLCELIGESVAARLISQAGSLTNLAKFPASTVQILGAEKALFRALKTRGNTPKYGLIYHSTFIGRAAKENKGKVSRFLASKCSLASRIDCFSDVPTSVFGVFLKKQMESRLTSLETGEAGPTNAEVMSQAVVEAKQAVEESIRKLKKKKKKEKKAKRKREKELENGSTVEEEAMEVDEVVETSAKKKKKNRASVEEPKEEVEEVEVAVESPKKKKKKNRASVPEEEEAEEEIEVESAKKKKKKNRASVQETAEEEAEEEMVTPGKKRKKNRPSDQEAQEEAEVETPKKKKKNRASGAEEAEEVEAATPGKKKKGRASIQQTAQAEEEVEDVAETSAKKKKKRRTNE